MENKGDLRVKFCGMTMAELPKRLREAAKADTSGIEWLLDGAADAMDEQAREIERLIQHIEQQDDAYALLSLDAGRKMDELEQQLAALKAQPIGAVLPEPDFYWVEADGGSWNSPEEWAQDYYDYNGEKPESVSFSCALELPRREYDSFEFDADGDCISCRLVNPEAARLNSSPVSAGDIPFAGFCPNFCPGSNPENPQEYDGGAGELDISAERNAMQRQRDQATKQLARECDDTDAFIRMVGLDPDQLRTDGGSLNLTKAHTLLAQQGKAVGDE